MEVSIVLTANTTHTHTHTHTHRERYTHAHAHAQQNGRENTNDNNAHSLQVEKRQRKFTKLQWPIDPRAVKAAAPNLWNIIQTCEQRKHWVMSMIVTFDKFKQNVVEFFIHVRGLTSLEVKQSERFQPGVKSAHAQKIKCTHLFAFLALTHSFTRPLAQSPTHSLAYSLAHSLTYSLTHTYTHPFTHSLTYLCSLVHCRACPGDPRSHRQDG